MQTAEVDNLDDGYVAESYPAVEYGAYNQISTGAPGSGAERQAYIKWSLGSIPQGSRINNASLQLYYAYDGLEIDDRLRVGTFYVFPAYNIAGAAWTEGIGDSSGNPCTANELCWNTRPSVSQISGVPESSIVFDKSNGALSGWYSWPVTQMVQEAVSNGEANITIALRSSWDGGSLAVSDIMGFRTKEYWSPLFRPVMVINYETGPVDDVAITSISVPSQVTPGSIVQINVTAKNEGNRAENFTVSVNDTTDGMLIGSANVTDLDGGSSLTLSYSWSTSSASYGNHTIMASASVVAGETDTADNVKNAVVTINIPDATPPMISNVSASPSQTSAAISWETDDASDSKIDYGLTQSLGLTITDPSLTTNHPMVLTGLGQNTPYYYRITSCNKDNYCNASSIDSFTTLQAEPVISQRIKGTTYKPNYGNETVEFAVAVMDNKTSIENNARFVGTDDWNVSYRVINPDNTTYQDWQNIAVNNSWGIASFNLSTGQTGTFTIQLKLADATTTPLENITFSVSENNQVPFYRNEIIRAADFVVSSQNPDGSFPGGVYTAPGSPARILMWAYRITGNLAYYNAAVNYLEDQINCLTTNNTLYSTCAYAEFQSASNDTQFANNLNSCVQPTYNLRNISPYYIERGEASYCLYKGWEATGSPAIKSYADEMVSSIINSNSWNAAKNTWYFSGQTYYDGIFTGTLTALGIPWYPDGSFINNAVQAQNLFAPQFYQDSSYGSGSTPSLYSLEILGSLSSGHFPHFTAEPAIAMSGIYKATKNRDWLLKASLPAKWIAKSQESDGRFEDIQSPSDDIWSTMWAVWGLYEFPAEVSAEVVDKAYNLTISDAVWNEKGKTLSANVTVPSSQAGKIRFVIPENENLGSVLIDGIRTANYIQNGRNVVVDVPSGNKIVEVLWGIDAIPPLRFNLQPSGSLPSGTTEATISLNTNENAACRYSTAPGTDYNSMADTFANTGLKSHSTLVTGLSDGSNYSYYVRCSDLSGNANTDDLAILFSIPLPDTSAPIVNLVSPQNITYNSGTIQLEYTATDNAAVNNCWYSLNNGNNITLPNCGNTTLNLQSGAYTLYLYANDTSSNIGLNNVAFTVNVTPPTSLNTTSVNVLDDTFASESSPASDYGTYNQMAAGGPNSYRRESYLKFNLTSIPSGSTIYEANLSLYISFHGLESNDIINITANLVYPLYRINNQEWDEGDGAGGCNNNELCWNTKPAPSQMSSLPESGVIFNGATIQTGSWSRWKVTNTIQQAVNNGSGNVTIRLDSAQIQSATDPSDSIMFRSREYYIAGLQPILSIRYGY